MKQEQIFNKVISDFSAGVLGFRNNDRARRLNNLANHLKSARYNLKNQIQPMAGGQSLSVSNYIELEINLHEFKSSLCSKLTLGQGNQEREMPIRLPLTNVIREDYFRHLCIEAYRLAKQEEERYFTGDELHERFVEELHKQLPPGTKIGVSGAIYFPHTPKTSFILKITDLGK